tara:strand:- start:116351 stop:117403 length:1053 start_codon:yes stop_codon:yes gene_type:complete
MKVLLITVRSDIGGGPKHVSDLLSHGGNAVDYYIAAPIDQFFSENFKKLAREFIGIPFRKFSLLAFIRLLLFLKKNEINIIHSHGRGAGLYSRLLKLFGYKVIHTFHGVHIGEGVIGKIKLLVDKLLVVMTDNFICVSSGELDEAIKHKVTRKKDTIVIPNGVEIFPYAEKVNNDPLVVGTLSRLNHQKGIDILISYIAKVVKEIDIPFVVKIAGDGEEKLAIESNIKSKNLSKYIDLIGATSEPQKFLDEIDIYISFARFEGMPLSVLEAVSKSLPCILSDVVGNNDIIKDNSIGYLFNLSDYESFKCEFLNIMKSKSERDEKSRLAHKYLQDNFSIENMIKETLKVYK